MLVDGSWAMIRFRDMPDFIFYEDGHHPKGS